MANSKALEIIGEEFIVGYRQQTEWNWLIASAFFLGELGAGVFLISTFVSFLPGLFAGLAIAVIGKGTCHVIYLGRPERFWRIIANPGSSWISRGLLAMIFFAILGIIQALMTAQLLGIALDSGLGSTIRYLAVLCAFVVLIYDGFVMAYSPAIPLWNTALMPILISTYGLMGGSTLALFMVHNGFGQMHANITTLESIELWLIVGNLLMIIVFLWTMFYSSATAHQSVLLLLKGRYSTPFLVGVIFVGLVITLSLALAYAAWGVPEALFGLALTELVGDFLVILLLLRAGVFTPILPETEFYG